MTFHGQICPYDLMTQPSDPPLSFLGMHHFTIPAFSPYGLPIDIKLLPEYLKEKDFSMLAFALNVFA